MRMHLKKVNKGILQGIAKIYNYLRTSRQGQDKDKRYKGMKRKHELLKDSNEQRNIQKGKRGTLQGIAKDP